MMIRLLIAAIMLVGAYFASYQYVLQGLPSAIMEEAVERLDSRGIARNQFVLSPRMTPQTQTIVRPAPDLAYSVCLVDLAGGPVRVTGVDGGDYASLSVFGPNTDNIFVTDLSQGSRTPRGVVIAKTDQFIPVGASTVPGSPDLPVVRISGEKAVALIRRLAPFKENYAAVKGWSKGDRCEQLETDDEETTAAKN